MLIYSGLSPHVMFLMGELSAISALLLLEVGPDSISFTARPEVETLLKQYYVIDHVHQMLRMRVNNGIFKPLENTNRAFYAITQLRNDHLDAMKSLATDAARIDGRDITDVPLVPQTITDGYYRGIFVTGKLVAMGGTHIIASRASLAAVGNIVVHPDFRRQGLGSLVTNAVTESLVLDDFSFIVLNIRQNNVGALKVYRKLGYEQVCPFIEGLAIRQQ